MDAPGPLAPTVRGKDLPGAVKVMPMGLDAAIKKRVSGEFKSERSGSSLAFSDVGQSSQTNQMSSSANQATSITSSFKQSSSKQMSSSSSMTSSKQMSSATTSSKQVASSSSMMSSSSQMMSSSQQQQQSFQSSSFESSSKQVTAKSESKGISFQQQDFASLHGAEIQQTELKDQIKSAITDLETEFQQEFKENIPANIKSPTPTKPQFQDTYSPTPLSKQDFFSPPPLESVPIQQPPFASEPAPFSPEPVKPVSAAPERNAQFHMEPVPAPSQPDPVPFQIQPDPVPFQIQQMQNGFSEFSSKNLEVKRIEEESSFTSTSQTNFEGNQLQESGSSSSMLQKIMTPASSEYDSSSLKRRDPRKMFTDSSFYNAKHHPTVADQVEMAHKLSSALFKDENKRSKGQQMYLNRAKKSGDVGDVDEVDVPKHDPVPNLKLVMNPEGKVHEWNDLDPNELPDAVLLAGHAVPSLPSPEVANPVVDDLNSNVGRGEISLHRPNSFVSAYRRVFDQNRGVFGTKSNTTGDPAAADSKRTVPDSPRLKGKTLIKSELSHRKDSLGKGSKPAEHFSNISWSPLTLKKSTLKKSSESRIPVSVHSPVLSKQFNPKKSVEGKLQSSTWSPIIARKSTKEEVKSTHSSWSPSLTRLKTTVPENKPCSDSRPIPTLKNSYAPNNETKLPKSDKSPASCITEKDLLTRKNSLRETSKVPSPAAPRRKLQSSPASSKPLDQQKKAQTKSPIEFPTVRIKMTGPANEVVECAPVVSVVKSRPAPIPFPPPPVRIASEESSWSVGVADEQGGSPIVSFQLEETRDTSWHSKEKKEKSTCEEPDHEKVSQPTSKSPPSSLSTPASPSVSRKHVQVCGPAESPKLSRRAPLSPANQNIISFFEQKHQNQGPANSLPQSRAANRKAQLGNQLSKSNMTLSTADQSNAKTFPHIHSTSRVAKTKALFEKENVEFAPLKKSRTFSSFPTDFTGFGSATSTPSPPKRSSSRKVTATYQFKSLNNDLDQCGLEKTREDVSTSLNRGASSLSRDMDDYGSIESPSLSRRPLRDFFK